MGRKESIEEAIKHRMTEGEEPLVAIENLRPDLKPDEATRKLLRRDPVETCFLELVSQPETIRRPWPHEEPTRFHLN